jgi:prepilin peptidase CpaA
VTALVALSVLAIIATWFDVRERRIPNWLAFGGMMLGLALHPLDGALGLLLGAAIFLPGFLCKMAGGGDVKLYAAAGSIAGWSSGLFILVIAAIANGVAALVYARRGQVQKPAAPALLVGAIAGWLRFALAA